MKEAYVFERVSGNVRFICRICGGSDEELIHEMRESNNYRAVNCMSSEKYSYVHNEEWESVGCTFLIFNKKKAIELIESSAWIKMVKEYASLYPASTTHIIELHRAYRSGTPTRKLLGLILKKYPNYTHFKFTVKISCI